MHTVGSRVWQENWKSLKMGNIDYRTWNMARNTEKREKWEMHTVRPGVCEKTEYHGKWETHKVGPVLWWESLKNVQYVKKTENHGK